MFRWHKKTKVVILAHRTTFMGQRVRQLLWKCLSESHLRSLLDPNLYTSTRLTTTSKWYARLKELPVLASLGEGYDGNICLKNKKIKNPFYFSFPNCMNRWTGDLCLATVPGKNLAYWRWANSVGRILATTNVTSLTKWLHWSPLLIWSSKALRLMPLTILPPSQVNSRLASSGFRAIVVDLITRKTMSFGNKVLLLLTRSYLFNVELQWYRTYTFLQTNKIPL